MQKQPNLFDYATSELSQDAFIAWLSAWANPICAKFDLSLHECAKSFIIKLLGNNDYVQVDEIKTIEVKKQWKNIDVSLIINNEILIVIEDKKGTKVHSNQLERYANKVKNKYNKILLIYYKMLEQGSYKKVHDAGYRVFSRKEMINVLQTYVSDTKSEKNNIVHDYFNHLRELDNEIVSFKTKSSEDWKKLQWIGFYTELQKEISANWGIVSNAKGGFLGFDWGYRKLDFDGVDFEQYLQLEEEKLVFKIHVKDETKRRQIRDKYRKSFLKYANNNNLSVQKYGKTGKTMSIGKLKSNYIICNNQGQIDIPKTLDNIKYITNLMNKFSLSER